MNLNYIWNGKLRGVFGAILLVIIIGFNKVADILTKLLVSGNLGSVGNNVSINKGLVYRYPKNIHLGNSVSIARGVEFFSERRDANLIIGDSVIITFDVRIDFSGGVVLGNNVVISKNTIIETHDHGLNPRSKPVYKGLKIDENVWIGSNAMILSDVRTIGKNSIIAAKAVVTKPVPPNVIVAGIPAKIIAKV